MSKLTPLLLIITLLAWPTTTFANTMLVVERPIFQQAIAYAKTVSLQMQQAQLQPVTTIAPQTTTPNPPAPAPVQPNADAISSVASVLANPMYDQRVTLQGQFLGWASDDDYLFSDGTGQVLADVYDFGGNVPLNQTVTVLVEVDFNEQGQVELDVLSISFP
jgi:uncharacterized protein YdeI (BOF family)